MLLAIPIGGGDQVASNLTFDLHAAYNFQVGPLKDMQVYLDGKNILNRSPPFYNGNTAGISRGGFACSYGSTDSSPIPIGRSSRRDFAWTCETRTETVLRRQERARSGRVCCRPGYLAR